jgi:hypothetical protein
VFNPARKCPGSLAVDRGKAILLNLSNVKEGSSSNLPDFNVERSCLGRGRADQNPYSSHSGRRTIIMKWLIACFAVLLIVAPALAGEDPYIAVVGNDINANPFYFSPKYLQFIYDQTLFGVPTTGEQFRAQMPVIQPEICDAKGLGSGPFKSSPPFTFLGRTNSRVSQGNAGWYEWYIRLPTKIVGEINLVFQCGIIKPDTFANLGFQAVNYCAAETGERITPGFCAHQFVDPGKDPIVPSALPRITAIAFPGPYNAFTPFYLTAYKNPGTYTHTFDTAKGAIKNDAAAQLLDGTTGTRILLKACMDKSVVAKIPVTGQLNAGAPPPPIATDITDAETDLVEGDLIYVRMTVPRQNTVDIYCHDQSLRLMGIGEPAFQIIIIPEL